MQYSRRVITLGIGAFALSACSSNSSPTSPRATSSQNQYPSAPNAAYDAWLNTFRGRAIAQGISPSVVDNAFSQAGFLPKVVERDRNQVETKRSFEDYLAIAASPTRVSQGRSELAQNRAVLSRIEEKWGVPANVVTAIWGLESRYGSRRGSVPVISAVSTLAFDGRRGEFFEKQLIAALRILERGDVPLSRMTGSWAGAMGHTQFIPTTFEAYAVDFTGDGRRDIWADDPTDALASAAAYLSRSGWVRGAPWGVEVTLPDGAQNNIGKTRSVSAWNDLGLRTASGSRIPNHGSATLLQPQSPGPAFLTFKNTSVLRRYNNSTSYVLGVGYLSDRINGAGPLVTSFGYDSSGLNLQERIEIQRVLNAKGFDAGDPDGVMGRNTQNAISSYQRANGLQSTGQFSRTLLHSLRR